MITCLPCNEKSFWFHATEEKVRKLDFSSIIARLQNYLVCVTIKNTEKNSKKGDNKSHLGTSQKELEVELNNICQVS